MVNGVNHEEHSLKITPNCKTNIRIAGVNHVKFITPYFSNQVSRYILGFRGLIISSAFLWAFFDIQFEFFRVGKYFSSACGRSISVLLAIKREILKYAIASLYT